MMDVRKCKNRRKDQRIRIVQNNTDRAKNVAIELRTKTTTENVYILAIQEPYVTGGNKIIGYGVGSRIITGEKQGERPWASTVVVNPRVSAMKIKELSNSHCVVTEIMPFKGESFYMINVYCQYKDEIDIHLNSIDLAMRKLKEKPVIIIMDANAKSPTWGGSIYDDRGREVEELIALWELTILNEQRQGPTYVKGKEKSFIDLTLVTKEMTERMKWWKIQWDWTSSSHAVIIIEVGSKKVNENERENKRWDLQKANWDEFRKVLNEEKDKMERFQISTRRTVVKYAVLIEKWILKAASKTMREIKPRPKRVKWWNKDLQDKRRIVLRLRKEYNKAEDEETKKNLERRWKAERREYRNKIETARQKSWEIS